MSIFRNTPQATVPAEDQMGEIKVFVVPAVDSAGQFIAALPVPGCKEIFGVRLGRLELPELIEYEVPDSKNYSKKLHVKMPMWELGVTEEGDTVLYRNIYSNDGYWQPGEKVYIRGVFEEVDDTPGVLNPDATPKRKSRQEAA